MDVSLVHALQNPTIYPHETSQFEVIQTHLSWIILTGSYAYKIKKPLNLGFQDFTTLEKRKYYCELETTLNKRLAPDLYIDVVAITGTTINPELNGTSEPIEYAIKMHQFSQKHMLSFMASENRLTAKIIKGIAEQLASFHLNAERAAPESTYGRVAAVIAPMRDNFQALFNMPITQPWHPTLKKLSSITEEKSKSLQNILEHRRKDGWIRATHGDVHLENIVLIHDAPVIFDCIEFNEDFRWTDTMNDIGFLFMDLIHKNLPDLAYIFINHYLEITGDYEGLALLSFYACYRAMVRAKITGFQMTQIDPASPQYQQLYQELGTFIHLAEKLLTENHPTLSITVGVSGSGKSSYTEKLMTQQGAFRLRSDVVRKQLLNLPLYQPTPEAQKAIAYSEETSHTVFEKIREYAKLYLQQGQSVIIDATCIKLWQRTLFASLAQELETPFKIFAFDVDLNELATRLEKRQKLKQVSDASIEIVHAQLKNFDALTAQEKSLTTFVTNNEVIDAIGD